MVVPKDEDVQHRATITMGGRDLVNCEAEWLELSIDDDGRPLPYWSVGINSIIIVSATAHGDNRTVEAIGTATISLNGDYRIAGPWDSIKQLMDALNATKRTDERYALESCEEIAQAPTLVFQFGMEGPVLLLTPYDYVVIHRQLDGTSQWCELAFTETGPLLSSAKDDPIIVDTEWVLGSRFLNSHCIAANYEKKTLAFSRSIKR